MKKVIILSYLVALCLSVSSCSNSTVSDTSLSGVEVSTTVEASLETETIQTTKKKKESTVKATTSKPVPTTEPETEATTYNEYKNYDGQCGKNLYWRFDDSWDDTLTISGTGDMYEYDNYGSNRAPWYFELNKIKRIRVDEGVTGISSGFSGSSVMVVELPNTLKRIGSMTFHNCTSLNTITIPYSVDSIGNHAFGCDGQNHNPVYIYGFSGTATEDYVNSSGDNIYFRDCSELLKVYDQTVDNNTEMSENEKSILESFKKKAREVYDTSVTGKGSIYYVIQSMGELYLIIAEPHEAYAGKYDIYDSALQYVKTDYMDDYSVYYDGSGYNLFCYTSGDGYRYISLTFPMNVDIYQEYTIDLDRTTPCYCAGKEIDLNIFNELYESYVNAPFKDYYGGYEPHTLLLYYNGKCSRIEF